MIQTMGFCRGLQLLKFFKYIRKQTCVGLIDIESENDYTGLTHLIERKRERSKKFQVKRIFCSLSCCRRRSDWLTRQRSARLTHEQLDDQVIQLSMLQSRSTCFSVISLDSDWTDNESTFLDLMKSKTPDKDTPDMIRMLQKGQVNVNAEHKVSFGVS